MPWPTEAAHDRTGRSRLIPQFRLPLCIPWSSQLTPSDRTSSLARRVRSGPVRYFVNARESLGVRIGGPVAAFRVGCDEHGMGAMSMARSVFEGVRHIVIDNLGSGSITVAAGTEPDLVESWIEAVDERFLEQVQIRHDQDWLRISVPQQFFGNIKPQLRLAIPDGLAFVIKTGAADISISADIGRSKIISGSGDITIGNAVDLDCSTGSGNISVASVDGTGAKLGSGSGDVSVGEVNCPITAKSGSGDLVVKSVRGATLQANSGSGDIAVSATSGSVDLRSASGSLTVGVADNLPAWIDLNSVSGDIRIGLESTAQPEPGEPYLTLRARMASGDIAVFRA